MSDSEKHNELGCAFLCNTVLYSARSREFSEQNYLGAEVSPVGLATGLFQ